MATAGENNIGASRLLGTNGLQQAVDSLSTQVTKLTTAVNSLASNSGGMNSSTGSGGKSTWNVGSNKTATGNGGGGAFTGASFSTKGRSNGGGGTFSGGSLSQGSKIAGTLSAVAGVGSALASYGNKNMSSNMQMDFYGMTQAQLGGVGSGGTQQASQAARNAVFGNNYLGTSVNDMAQAGYINSYTFGQAAQLNGQANPLFKSQMNQVQGFGYTSPTLGSTGAAQAAQQTYTARSNAMALALGLGGTIGPGGVKNTMGSIAQSIMAKSLAPGKQYTTSNIAIALGQGGGLGTNLQSYGQQMGWSQQTIQEYQNYMIGQVTAQSKGISASQYQTLTSQASNGNATARNKLQTAGIGSSMYTAQNNLNATGITRQNDVLNTLAPAFDKTTSALNNLSGILTTMMNGTGMTGALGMGAGIASPLSNSLKGFSGTFGAAAGLYGAARLFGGGGGLLGGLSNLFKGSGGAAAGTSATGLSAGMTATSAGAGGVFDITSVAAGGAGIAGGTAVAGVTGGLGVLVGGAALLANWRGNALLKDQHGVNIPGGYTQKDFNDYMAAKGQAMTYLRGGWNEKGVAAGWEKAYFQQNPAGYAEQKGYKTPGGNGPMGGMGGVGMNIPQLAALGNGKPVSDGRAGGGSSGVMGSQSGSSSTVTGAGSANAAEVINFARTQLGVPYVWGGESPGKGFDCSGLTQWAYGKAGVKIPRVAADQQKVGTPVNPNNAQPGDLLFVGNPAHHVVMAIGGGKVIEAPHTGSNVNIESLIPSQYSSATRIVGALGNLGSLTNSNSSPNQNTLNNQQSMSGGDIGGFGISGTSEADVVSSALAGSISSLPLTANSTSSGSTSGAATGGGVAKGNGNNSKSALQAYAKQLLAKYGWAGQWDAFNSIEMSEAGWNYQATNPSSGAYGLAQALPASKYASAGSDWKTNGDTQLQWMMQYIKGRYGSPDSAWSFHQANNWYAAGAWDIDKDQTATVHQGEMIIPAQQAETIRQTLVNNTFNPNVAKNSGSGMSINFGDINVSLPASFMGSSTEAKQIGKMIADATQQQLRISNLQTGQ